MNAFLPDIGHFQVSQYVLVGAIKDKSHVGVANGKAVKGVVISCQVETVTGTVASTVEDGFSSSTDDNGLAGCAVASGLEAIFIGSISQEDEVTRFGGAKG